MCNAYRNTQITRSLQILNSEYSNAYNVLVKQKKTVNEV